MRRDANATGAPPARRVTAGTGPDVASHTHTHTHTHVSSQRESGGGYVPDGAPGVGIAFGFVDRVPVSEEGLVDLADGRVTPAQQVETLARFGFGFDGLLQVLDGERFALVALAQRLARVVQPTCSVEEGNQSV